MNTEEKIKSARLASVAAVVPPYCVSQSDAEVFVQKHYADKLSKRSLNIIHKALNHQSIQKRHFAFDNLEILINEDADGRIKRFTDRAIELSGNAIKKALSKTGLKVEDITGLVVNTCTGYICPGLSTYLIEKLGLNRNIKSFDLVGSGCGGAMPNFQICEALLRESPDNIILSVSVEICSATFQMTNDPSQLISDSIFGDGAAASVLWNRPRGLELISSGSLYIPEYREDVRFVYKNGQLHNQLSTRLPNVAGKSVSELIKNLLKKSGLKINDIKHWALHPGGENVINALRDEIGLSEEQLHYTRSVLSKYGNMSSPTVMFILRDIIENGVNPGEWILAASFGAGFSAHAYLLRK
ncbi:MAG: type III polyketide synthase [Elusimicrobiota bacterium]|nr:type III polyketide synthase [Elusimicrobiota bacterium]